MIDLSIPLRFNGPQPNAFGVEPAKAKMLGDTRTGSSVNFAEYTFTPHCNGTHTECVGHITDERISVRDCLQDVLSDAVLISVSPVSIGETKEKLTREASDRDSVITKRSLMDSLNYHGQNSGEQQSSRALIIRTLPNDDSKLTRAYNGSDVPPYFTADAIQAVVELGFDHILVDLPSIDRLNDGGLLENHRTFWNVAAGKSETNDATRIRSTITELIYVPNEIEDGEYLLNLQIAPFNEDCAPSRPVLLKTLPQSCHYHQK